MTLTIRAYARLKGVNESSVRKAIRAGRISLNEEGLIDPEKADRAWLDNTRDSIREETDGDDKDLETYADLRREHLRLKYQKERFEFDQLKNDYVKKKAACSFAYNQGKTLRERVDNLPHRLSDVLASTQDPQKIEKLLEKELGTLLEVFDGWFP